MTQTNEDDEVSLKRKHKDYNKAVQDAISSKKKLDEKTFTALNRDTDNLMKIDIACHNMDINYILSVLKSRDMLYVSRAIKKSAWLVDDQYENIINPQYLNNEIFPEMTTKACNKFLKHIRHYLRTERRVEDFYNNETTPEKAEKWLSRCSVPFIIKNIDKHMHNLSCLEYKRLCEKSVSIFEASMKSSPSHSKLKAASFLLNTHIEQYLDVFESVHRYNRFRFSSRGTELIMKQTPDRVKNKFLMYIYHIHVSTFVKYMKKEEIKEFLYKLANKDEKEADQHICRIFEFKIMKQFVKRMPFEEQFKFVKKVFLDKNICLIKDETLERGSEMFAIKRICTTVSASTPSYHWYEFAPFDVAFNDMKKLMQAETDIHQKYSMLAVLLKCAGTNVKDLLSLLTYFFKNHHNDEDYWKTEFVNNYLLPSTEFYKTDDETWNTFKDILNNLNVYTEHSNEKYVDITILFNILHDKQITGEIEKNFKFKTFNSFRSKLNQDNQNKLFDYLFNYMTRKIGSDVQTEEKFSEFIYLHLDLLNLLKDWDKHIKDYPNILTKIRKLVHVKMENNWKNSLSKLYTKEKSWKRYMFEESLLLNPSHEVCLNALKHDPGLLKRYMSEVEKLCCNDKISVEQLMKKIRIYWPESLSQTFTKSYVERMTILGNHKALTRGLFTLLPQKPLCDIIKQYAPVESKIDWNNTNELTLSLQRHISKNMHIARPQPDADAILLYAKGDFLQYALPSLIAIYYNMNRVDSQQHIPKLLTAPVSLQKHGLRFAFIKLKHDELKKHLVSVWNSTKNTTIRAVTFSLLFDLLCKQKDDSRAVELWEILEVFMDNISFQEDKKLYDKLPKVQDVPLVIRAKFLVKSYNFLKVLLPHLKNDRGEFEYAIDNLAVYTREVIESVCPNFAVELITEFLTEKFYNGEISHISESMLKVVTSYILCAKDESDQTKRYEQILAPLVKRCIAQWNDTNNERFFIREHFKSLLKVFSEDLRDYVICNKMVVPTKLFGVIKNELDTHLEVPQNYVLLTMWKLIVKLAELIANIDNREDWTEVSKAVSQSYGSFCLNVLKEDVKLYFSCIYILYSKVMSMAIQDILPEVVHLEILQCMLLDVDFIQAHLVAIKLLADRQYWYRDADDLKNKEKELKKILCNHPSVEVKMHYYCAFKSDIECE